MEKEFKTLLGNRVYLEVPKKEESKVIVVDENTKDSVKRELLSKMRKLKVIAIGEGVNQAMSVSSTLIKEGDYVLVDPEALARKAVVIPLTDEKDVMLVSYFDIIHVW